MRLLHQFDSREDAERLAEVLYAERIETTVNAGSSGKFSLWVHSEDDLPGAKAALATFLDDPDDPRFVELLGKAKAARKAHKKAEKKSRFKQVDARTTFSTHGRPALGGLTIFLIALSCIVALATNRGQNDAVVRHFLFYYSETPPRTYLDLFAPILSGQVWRVISPIFVHFGMLHLIFNMWWLKDLGSLIERKHSSLYLLGFVFVTGVLSNIAQVLALSPNFGGMSGVIYALFGFLWIRGRFDPTYGIALQKQTVILMIGWFVLCWAGIFNIANMAHTAGLVLGMIWGYLSSGHLRRKLQR